MPGERKETVKVLKINGEDWPVYHGWNPFLSNSARAALEESLLEKLEGREIEAGLAAEWMDKIALDSLSTGIGFFTNAVRKKLAISELVKHYEAVPGFLLLVDKEKTCEALVEKVLSEERNYWEIYEAACIIALLNVIEGYKFARRKGDQNEFTGKLF